MTQIYSNTKLGSSSTDNNLINTSQNSAFPWQNCQHLQMNLKYSVRNSRLSSPQSPKKAKSSQLKRKSTETDNDGFKFPPKHLVMKQPRGAATLVSNPPISISTNPISNSIDLADDPVPPAPLARRPPFFVV
ncbi:hypothetical protein CDAR_232101 [Caerostris darwini]|uniref:Uncharacterized protein n=1 Tax=Caerostris darwini TaxID=1538125 RepID=A0AAV4RZ18_9ARAC|nr:hypothetical protein CDAR_232101 [Caerostris darwini]